MRTSPQREGHEPTHSSASPSPQTDVRRRRFIFALGAGSAATVAATAQAVAAPILAGDAARDAEPGSGYRESEHVRTYYASTRI